MLYIRNIINKLQEIDKLKLLLLSDEQLIIFGNLPKPLIQNYISHQYGRVLVPNKRIDYFAIYDEMKRKEEKTEIDLKLLNMSGKKAGKMKTKLESDRTINVQRVKFQIQRQRKFN